jgi:hypothetical protein
MTMQVAIPVGIPVLGTAAVTQRVVLAGVRVTVSVNVAARLVSMIFVWLGAASARRTPHSSRSRGPRLKPAAAARTRAAARRTEAAG